MKRIIILLFSLITIVSICGCSVNNSMGEIDTYLEELDARDQFSGAVLVAKDGDPILERAYGIANRTYDVPNQLDTKFNLGSMNKMFTAVAILQLVEQGKISVDDKIVEHIPEYPNQEVANTVTIHQLLTHTSGLMDLFTQEFREISKDQLKEIDDYLPLFEDKPLLFEPGTRFSYSNSGFIVLGMIIEESTGQTYYDYVRENIYQPCGMTDTDSFEVDRIVPNVAIGYAGYIRNYDESLASNFYWLPFKGISAGGGYSTIRDMLNFSNCLMNHQLLSLELTEALLEGKVAISTPDGEGKYAYGFMVSTINNHRIVGHSGGMPGVCSNLDIAPDLGYTIVVLSNSSHDCTRVFLKIRETLLN